MEKLTAELAGVGGMSAELSSVNTLSAGLTIPQAMAVEEYSGPYEVTPSEDAQTLEISGKKGTDNIVINAIPSNYGRIAWDGTALTVY